MVGHARNLRDSRKRINFFAGELEIHCPDGKRSQESYLERVLKNKYTCTFFLIYFKSDFDYTNHYSRIKITRCIFIDEIFEERRNINIRIFETRSVSSMFFDQKKRKEKNIGKKKEKNIVYRKIRSET